MNETDGDLSPYKDMTREDIEKLSGLEQEMAQIATGIWLSRRITIKPVPESPKVQEYIDLFGHRPAMEAYKFLSRDELDAKAAEAIERGEPVPFWRDRYKIKTGSLLDDLYK